MAISLSPVFTWPNESNQSISWSLPHSVHFEGADEESDHLTSISYTSALWRTSPLWLLSSLKFSCKLSNLLITTVACPLGLLLISRKQMLPFLASRYVFPSASKISLAHPTCCYHCESHHPIFYLVCYTSRSPFLVNEATANCGEPCLMIEGWLPKGLMLISFPNT